MILINPFIFLFLHLSLGFKNKTLPFLSDAFPFQKTLSNSPFLPSKPINSFSLSNNVFGFSWIEQSNNSLFKEIMVTQIYDSFTGEALWPSPLVFDQAIYDFPMVVCEVFFPEKGIMGFWTERASELENVSILYIQSFYVSEKNDLKKPKEKITEMIQVNSKNHLSSRMFDAKYIPPKDLDDSYLVAWANHDPHEIKSTLMWALVGIEYWKSFPKERFSDDEFEEIISLLFQGSSTDPLFYMLFSTARINASHYVINSYPSRYPFSQEENEPAIKAISNDLYEVQPPILLTAIELMLPIDDRLGYLVIWTQNLFIIWRT